MLLRRHRVLHLLPVDPPSRTLRQDGQALPLVDRPPCATHVATWQRPTPRCNASSACVCFDWFLWFPPDCFLPLVGEVSPVSQVVSHLNIGGSPRVATMPSPTLTPAMAALSRSTRVPHPHQTFHQGRLTDSLLCSLAGSRKLMYLIVPGGWNEMATNASVVMSPAISSGTTVHCDRASRCASLS